MHKTDIFMELIDEGSIPLRTGFLRIVDDAIEAGVRLAVCSTSNEKAVYNLVSTLTGGQVSDLCGGYGQGQETGAAAVRSF